MSSGSLTAINDLFVSDKDANERVLRFNGMIDRVLKEKDGSSRGGTPELEAILYGFAGPGRQGVTMTQYQRILGFLKSRASRETEGEEVYMNIQPHGGKSIRASIIGDAAIKEYCETDMLPDDATYTEKTFMNQRGKSSGETRKKDRESVFDSTLGFRVNLKRETSIDSVDVAVREMIRGWERSRKTFRVIQRESFSLGPFRIDCSRVRQSDGRTLEDSGVLDVPIVYEIEIELMNDRIVSGITKKNLTRQFLKVIMRSLQVLRGSWFLMTHTSRNIVLREYASLTKQSPPMVGKNGNERLPSFVGPMPITLERSMIPRVRSGEYTVTQKADGERAFMMIDSGGNASFIFRTMDVESTGLEIKDVSVHKTILDGEVITRGSDGSPIHPPMYMVFDCYMVGGEVITGLPLIHDEDEESRLGAAERVVDVISTPGAYSVRWGDERHAVRVAMKPFVRIPHIHTDESRRTAETMITEMMGSAVPYETDGLVFTPANEPVRGYRGKDSLLQIRGTWSSVMKWKAPQDNTVDFLLQLSKTKSSDYGEDGVSLAMGAGGVRDGTLYVLGDAYTDDMLFDIQDAPDDELRRKIRESENQAVPFQRGVNKIQLETTTEGVILAKSGEMVVDDTIVECAWDPELVSVADEETGGWVIRNVRWDKTATYRRSGDPRGTMNAERTAASVWVTAVEDPVRVEDIWTADAVFDDEPDGGGEDTREGYFNRRGSRGDSLLARMTDFHNLVVKASLLSPRDKRVTRDAVIVDLACGQGGDIPRFQSTDAAFIFGMDVEPDNLLNRERGAIKRYITRRMDMLSGSRRVKHGSRKIVPMRFALADCGKDLFATGDDVFAAIGDKSKEIVRRTLRDIEGTSRASSSSAASRVGDYRGLTIGSGADRVTCMFAVHYFFRDSTTVTTFFRNVTRLLRPRRDDSSPPCFIACCFDGDKIEDLLLAEGGEDRTVSRYVKTADETSKLAWSIRGRYDIEDARAAASAPRAGNEALGLRISVYIETINKEHDEYVVRDSELRRRAAEHGLRIANEEEATSLGFTRGAGTFEEMFEETERGPSRGIGKAMKMLDHEKELSFLYRWFILVPSEPSE
jgi:hypothetical protein